MAFELDWFEFTFEFLLEFFRLAFEFELEFEPETEPEPEVEVDCAYPGSAQAIDAAMPKTALSATIVVRFMTHPLS